MMTMATKAQGVGDVTRLFLDRGIVFGGHTSALYRDEILAIELDFGTPAHRAESLRSITALRRRRRHLMR